MCSPMRIVAWCAGARAYDNSRIRVMAMRARPCRLAGLTLLLAVIAPTCLRAQSPEPFVAVGVALPSGGLGAQQAPGPVVRGGLTYGDRDRSHVRLRVELEAALLPGRAANRGTFRSGSALVSLLVGTTAAPVVAPYGLVGLAVERLAITGVRNPYGTTVGLRAGLGVRSRVWSRPMFVEVAPHLAVTDFATSRDYSAGVRVPIVVGVAF